MCYVIFLSAEISHNWLMSNTLELKKKKLNKNIECLMKFKKKTSNLDLVIYSRSVSHGTCYICMDINAVNQ